MSQVVLGLDGGLAHMGLAIAHLTEGERPRIVWSGVIETTKDPIGTAAADNVRRARELHAELAARLALHRPSVIYAESMSHPRDARAAAMLSMSWGVVAALADQLALPVWSKSPMALKRAMTGNQTAKKAEMIAAVREQYPEVEWPERRDLHEHVADAVAAVHAFCGVPA